MAFGLAWIFNGFAAPHTETLFTPQSLLLPMTIPYEVRLAIWFSTGALAVLCGMCPTSRVQTVGFMVLMIAPVTRAFTHLYGFLVYVLTPGTELGFYLGWAYGAIWICLAYAIRVAAGWRDDVKGVA